VAQTWTKKEIIVVDDGSSDNTLAIAKQFESASVRVYAQRNQGAAAARNEAFRLCRGDYIQWLDADDILAPNKVEKQVIVAQQARRNRLLISGAWGSFLHRHHRAKFIPTLLHADLSPAEWLIRKMANNLHMQTATWLVSRELTAAAGAWNTELLVDDDGEYFCRVLLESEGVKFVPEARVYYRAAGSGSLSYIGRCNDKRDSQWKSMELHLSYLRTLEKSPRADEACIAYLRTWLPFFYPDRLDLVRKAEAEARSLGAELGMPKLSWKYAWIEALFGAKLAKRASVLFPNIRWSMMRFWDKILLHLLP